MQHFKFLANNHFPTLLKPLWSRERDYLFDLEQSAERHRRMRWVSISINNIDFSIYTHHTMDVIQHEVHNIIEPFIFESNNHNNRSAIQRWLASRFHMAVIGNYGQF